jgi:hypothetical protein
VELFKSWLAVVVQDRQMGVPAAPMAELVTSVISQQVVVVVVEEGPSLQEVTHRPVQLKGAPVVVQHHQSVHQPPKALERRKVEHEIQIQTVVVVAAERVEMGLTTTVQQMLVMVGLDCKVPLLEPQHITQAVAEQRTQ